MKFSLLDVVKVVVAVPAVGVAAGDVGTVVEVYGDGNYEVEFCNGNGETLAMLALAEHQLRPANELLQAA